MKKGLIMITMTSMLLASVPAYGEIIQGPVPGMTIEITYENGRKVITTHCSPEFSASIQEKVEKPPFEPIPPLEEAPEVGVTLGHILDETADPSLKGSGRFTEAYQPGTIGQCTWYAEGRFAEVHGIRMPFGMGSAKKWIANAGKSNEIKTVLDIEAIQEQSIAVFAPVNSSDTHPGHVVFIEYVEKVNDKPEYIYFSEGNSNADGIFDPSIDGTVKKKSFSDFKKGNRLKLIGYIVPDLKTEIQN